MEKIVGGRTMNTNVRFYTAFFVDKNSKEPVNYSFYDFWWVCQIGKCVGAGFIPVQKNTYEKGQYLYQRAGMNTAPTNGYFLTHPPKKHKYGVL